MAPPGDQAKQVGQDEQQLIEHQLSKQEANNNDNKNHNTIINNNNEEEEKEDDDDLLRSPPSDPRQDKSTIVVIETCALGSNSSKVSLNGSVPTPLRQQLEEDISTVALQPRESKLEDQESSQRRATNLSHPLKQLQPNQASPCLYPAPKRRRLSYLQALLLRRWPFLAISICIMSSLLFGMLLSALTVYLMHAHVSECMSALLPVASGPHRHQLEPTSLLLQRNRLELDSPMLELAAGNPEPRSGSAAAIAGNQRAPFQRLPRSLFPIHYDLFIQPWIREPFNFNGKVSVTRMALQLICHLTRANY